MVDHRTGKLVAAFAAAAGLAFGGLAHAQTSNAGAVAMVRANNQSVVSAYATAHDAKGAAVSTDGAVEAGEDQSGFASGGTTDGAFDTLSGVGSTSAATIFGGGLNVVTTAPGATAPGAPAKVNDNQTNTSGGGATASPSGGVFNVDHSNQHQ